jgi:F-type H+-transporting ATPase subunit b
MEKASFASQLGIDWKLLLSQAVNFLLLLFVLRMFVYKPLLAAMNKRKEKIEEGLAKAEEADVRLREVGEISKKKLKEAEQSAIATIKQGEQKAKEVEADLLDKVREKEVAYMQKVERNILAEKDAARKEIEREAAKLVKQALIKTVELDPEEIDEALIKKAVEQVS